jgi:hypothetical protein
MDHAERMREKIRNLRDLIKEERKLSKPDATRIDNWEREIANLEGHLKGGR